LKIAIISDIHGNLEALTTALDIISEIKTDLTICLGDIVGYGPDPEECVHLIREHCKHVLMGNHDQAVTDHSATKNFNDIAKEAVLWTAERLAQDSMEYLKALPLTLSHDGALFVHASPSTPEKWNYLFTYEDATKEFTHLDQNICFVGHTHFPAIFSDDPNATEITRTNKYIINVGSIGQPRDQDPRLSFGVFDTEKWEYHYIRADYPVQMTYDKIIDRGLPRFLAERLVQGR